MCHFEPAENHPQNDTERKTGKHAVYSTNTLDSKISVSIAL